LTGDVFEFVIAVSWIATAIGFGLWLWSWLKETDVVRKQRFGDCGVVLLFSSILLRIVAQERPMGIFDWAMVFISPLFIAAALWRLGRTAGPSSGR